MRAYPSEVLAGGGIKAWVVEPAVGHSSYGQTAETLCFFKRNCTCDSWL